MLQYFKALAYKALTIATTLVVLWLICTVFAWFSSLLVGLGSFVFASVLVFVLIALIILVISKSLGAVFVFCAVVLFGLIAGFVGETVFGFLAWLISLAWCWQGAVAIVLLALLDLPVPKIRVSKVKASTSSPKVCVPTELLDAEGRVIARYEPDDSGEPSVRPAD